MAELARFLLVEDDMDTRLLVRHTFRRHAIENPLEEAGSGNEALVRLLDATAPAVDVVLLDQGLPDIAGLDVAARMLAEPRLAGIAVFLFSGHGAAALGPNPPANVKGALEKPLDVGALLRLLKRHTRMTTAIRRA